MEANSIITDSAITLNKRIKMQVKLDRRNAACAEAFREATIRFCDRVEREVPGLTPGFMCRLASDAYRKAVA